MLHGGEIYHGRKIEYDFSVNINPLGLPEAAVRALREDPALLTQYPDQECRALRRALARFTGVPAEQILCGNGASELIEASVRALRPQRILLTAPSFSGYRHAAEGAGAEIVYHRLRREEGFSLTERYLEDLSGCPDMAVLCSPANPVGNLIDPSLFRRILEQCERQGTWLLVDECFIGFIEEEEQRTARRYLRQAGSGESAGETAPDRGCAENGDRSCSAGYPHLLVLDAFTKRFAMPGLRLGYLMASDPELLDRIHAQQPEWSVSVAAQTAGTAVLEAFFGSGDSAGRPGQTKRESEALPGGSYPEQARALIRDERRKMAAALQQMGLRVYPGEANFIFFSSETELQEPLLSRGILIRSCDNYPGLRRGDYRAAVLRPEQNGVLLREIGEILGRSFGCGENGGGPAAAGEVREKAPWEDREYSFFQHTACEYFPCHRIADPSQFNCLFCYCPLYALGRDCGGNFRYTEKGIKDCTGCVIPHLRGNYGRIIGNYPAVVERMKQMEAAAAGGAASERGTAAAPIENAQTSLNGGSVQEALPAGSEQEASPAGAASAARPRSDLPDRKQEAGRRIVMMACTERGFDAMRRAAEALRKRLPGAEILQTGRCAHVPGFEDGPRLSELTEKWFREADALVFFTATGIAVRCIAPFAQDKFRDPAVLAVDENGRFVIPLLSGHAGGANRLCRILADEAGAQPVITTATDGRGLFAVDVYAVENGLQISDRTIAREISARLLAGEEVSICHEVCGEEGSGHGSRFRSVSGLPSPEEYGAGVRRAAGRENADIIVSCRREPADRPDALYLIPRAVTLGIGCRKGTSAASIRNAAEQALRETGVFPQALCGIASIDLKKEEEGLQAFAKERDLPLVFYTAEELNALPGSYTSSAFVRGITGVDCVCERSAVRLAGAGAKLIAGKQSREGVTTALALGETGR